MGTFKVHLAITLSIPFVGFYIVVRTYLPELQELSIPFVGFYDEAIALVLRQRVPFQFPLLGSDIIISFFGLKRFFP